MFNKFQSPGLEPPKTIVGTNFGQIWGVGVFFECCKRKKRGFARQTLPDFAKFLQASPNSSRMLPVPHAFMGSQHPSPNVKTLRNFEPNFWFKGLFMARFPKRWFEFSGGTKFRYPLFTSMLPSFYLFFTSFKTQFNLCFFTNLEPRLGNHGLQTLCWPEMIIPRDAESTCFKGSRASCEVMIFWGIFWPNFGQKRSHHVMDASSPPCNFPDCRHSIHSNGSTLPSSLLVFARMVSCSILPPSSFHHTAEREVVLWQFSFVYMSKSL